MIVTSGVKELTELLRLESRMEQVIEALGEPDELQAEEFHALEEEICGVREHLKTLLEWAIDEEAQALPSMIDVSNRRA